MINSEPSLVNSKARLTFLHHKMMHQDVEMVLPLSARLRLQEGIAEETRERAPLELVVHVVGGLEMQTKVL